jgi:methylmalonyl-CoA epimerase
MQIKRIHHVTIAVRDVDRAAGTFEGLFGAGASDGGDVPAFGVRTRDVPIGESVLQVAAPLEAGGPVARFIERKGEGFYNLALEVEDLDAAIDELRQRGIKISDPVEATPGVRSSFVTMSATHGLSVQLVEVVREQEPLDLTPDEWSDDG